jgi:hypothetical protein
MPSLVGDITEFQGATRGEGTASERHQS